MRYQIEYGGVGLLGHGLNPGIRRSRGEVTAQDAKGPFLIGVGDHLLEIQVPDNHVGDVRAFGADFLKRPGEERGLVGLGVAAGISIAGCWSCWSAGPIRSRPSKLGEPYGLRAMAPSSHQVIQLLVAVEEKAWMIGPAATTRCRAVRRVSLRIIWCIGPAVGMHPKGFEVLKDLPTVVIKHTLEIDGIVYPNVVIKHPGRRGCAQDDNRLGIGGLDPEIPIFH